MTAPQDFADSQPEPSFYARAQEEMQAAKGRIYDQMLFCSAVNAIYPHPEDATPVDSMPQIIDPMPEWATFVHDSPLYPGKLGQYNGFTILKSRNVGTSESIAARSKPVPMLTKQVDRILSNHGRARPPQMPRNLRIYIRPSYPWFHSCGYAVGHARVSPPLKPMRIVPLAVQYLALAPTLTHQA